MAIVVPDEGSDASLESEYERRLRGGDAKAPTMGQREPPATPAPAPAPAPSRPALAEPAPKQATADLDAQYEAVIRTQQTTDKAVLNRGSAANADEKGKAYELSQKIGVPIEVVERNLPEAAARARALDAEAALANAPITTDFFRDPDNAAMAADSAKSLSLFEHAWNKSRSLVAGAADFPGSAVEGLGIGYQSLLRQWQRGTSALFGLRPAADVPGIGGLFNAPEAKAMTMAGRFVRSVADAVRPPAEQRDLGDEVAEGLGQVASQIAVAIASGGASSIVTTLSTFGSGVSQQADKIKELGLEPTAGTDAALMLGGAITAVTERFGLGNLLERIPATFKTQIGRILAGASSEAAQEFVENILQNLTALAIYNPNQEVMEGVKDATTVGGLVGAIVSAIMPGKRAIHFQKQMDEGRKALEESNLADRSPKAQADFVARVWEANGITDFYVPIKALDELAQGKPDATDFYRTLGVEDQLDTARLTNGDVRIPARAYAEHLYTTDDYAAIKDHTREKLGEMTPAEAKEYAEKGVREDVKRLGLDQKQLGPDEVSRDPKQSPPMTVTTAPATPPVEAGSVRLYTAAPKDSKADGPEWYTTDKDYAERFAAKMPKGQVYFIDTPADDPAFAKQFPPRMTNRAAGQHAHVELPAERAAGRKVFNDEPVKAAANADVAIAEQQAGLGALFSTAAEAGMTPTQYTAYLEQVQRAQDTARDRMAQRYLREQQRSTEVEWQRQREIIRDQVEQQVRQEPLYAALDSIGRERLNQAAVREILAETWADPDAALKALPKIDGRTIYAPKSEGGIHPDVLAQQHGFVNAGEMLKAFGEAKPVKKVIDERTSEIMDRQFGELSDERRRVDAALQSLHNDRAAAVIATELDALRDAKKEGRTNPALIRAFAREQMQNMYVGDVNARQFLEAEKREAREAGKFVRANDRLSAAQAKFRQLLNFQYASEAIALAETLPKQRKELQKFLRNRESHKNIGADYIDQIRALLANVDLNDKRIKLADWNVLYSRVKELEAKGRREQQIVVAGRKMEFEAVRNELVDKANELPDTRETVRSRTSTDTHGVYAVAAKAVSWAQAEFGKVEFMLQKLDGGNPTGPWHRAIFQPVADAQTAELDMRKGTVMPLVKKLEELPNASKRARTKVHVPELGLDMRISELWMLALNAGNQSNLDKVVDGSVVEAQRTGRQPWTHEGVIQALTTHLTEKEWQWVQSVWDAYAQMYPEVERIYRDEHGQAPERIEPSTIRTPEGATLKGGYFPMLYDTSKAVQADRQSTLELFEGDQVRASVYSGMTKTRTGYAAPVLLELGALPRALDQHIHFITHFDAVKDVRKVLQDTRIGNAVKNKLSDPQYKEMRDWAEAVATGNIDSTTRTFTSRMGEFFRGNITAAIMGLSYTTGVSQLFGYTSTIAVLGQNENGTFSHKEGVKWTAIGVTKYLQNPTAAIDTAFKLSGELRHRFGNADRDISEAMRVYRAGENIVTRAMAKQQRLALSMIAGIQMYSVDLPTWIGAYNQAQARGYDRERSVMHADAALRTSQASGHVKDLSQIQRDKGVMRWLTMFGSYTTLLYNLEAQTIGNAKSAPMSSIGRFGWLVAAPAVADALMRMDLPGDDDNEAVWWPLRVASYGFSAVPIAGRAADSMLRGYDPNLSPIETLGRLVPNALKSTGKIFTDDDFEAKDFRNIFSALGNAFGIGGTTQITRVLKAMEADDDANLYDYLIGYDEKRKRKGN